MAITTVYHKLSLVIRRSPMLYRFLQSRSLKQSFLNYICAVIREKWVRCSVQLPIPCPVNSCPDKDSVCGKIFYKATLENLNLH